LALLFKDPIGPVMVIAPYVPWSPCASPLNVSLMIFRARWNSSVILGSRAIATPIGAGCTVVLKASELCPRTHHYLVELFHQAGLPKGVLNVIQCRREDSPGVTETLISHRAIRKVDFIGSAKVGKHIGQMCAKHLKPILMELGGKGPAVVLDDADVKQAARMCAVGGKLITLLDPSFTRRAES